MASSNIKLFDENKGNMLSDSEFNISNQRLNGLQTGVASSQLQNKAMYQASLVAYAIAQVMMQNGKNANDTDAVSAFVANISGTMLQKVYDLATTAEAQAGVATGKWMSPALVKAAIDTLAAKANNILSSSTKALYGLGDNATPDDVLALLSRFPNGLGNEYIWNKATKTIEPGYTEYQYGSNSILIQLSSSVGSTQNATIHYGDSYVLNADGKTISIPNETTFVLYYSSDASVLNVLKGKWWWSTKDGAGSVYYLPSNAQITKQQSGSTYNFKTTVGQTWRYNFYPITKYTSYGYVNSPDRNAYPPAMSDGYTYLPLGQLGAKVQITTGGYTGTGTYGADNKNRLTFPFVPKIVFITSVDQREAGYCFWAINGQKSVRAGVSANYGTYISWDNTSLSWSGSNAAQQLNNSGEKYTYIAIG